VCRYTYDRNVLEARGENYVLEEYAPRHVDDVANDVVLSDVVPAAALEACACEHPGYSRAVLMQARSISHWFPYDRVGVVNADP
jgi:hypothetical protein